ncbi:Ribosomal RNA small subunit methyltransferase B [Thalassoglobus neptunius]|uniref:Ribosomal RNA small subunit methyltransferase B n=1 Tax=Thalassoglobus neptunius TaxID=1938619 RepID=A0A5C5X8H3_9PLAN|nr:transcription antitermination factor NusB [Thalassoglobus neptunius]TWT59019.1 Ribosomal RNA small subunit methyltransferase B [Thalassoglobus neptunius]
MNRPPHRRSSQSGKHPQHKRKSIPPNSRWFAFRALQAFHERQVFVSRVLNDQFKEERIDSRDRKMATELTCEAVRRMQTLDTILTSFVSRRREEVEDDLWILLQLGCLQLVFLPHYPSHAAVHETVELCRRIDRPRAAGFLNGVLRSIERSIVSRKPVDEIDLAQLSASELPIRRSRPDEANYEVVKFDSNLFWSPTVDSLSYVSDVGSLPQWLIQRFPTESDEQRLQLALWLTTPGRMWMRVNPLQTDREKTLEVLAAAEVKAQPGQLPESIQIDGHVAIIDLPGYDEGWFSVQDISAMAVTDLLDPQPGETVLDLCAAPGGKSTHMAERMENRGRIIACDTGANRLRMINENARRLQLTCIETHLVNENETSFPANAVDAAVVDVPCSNTGVLGKRPEARWRLLPGDFQSLVPLQRRLLTQAIDQTKSGGRIVYSTCSIDPEENEKLVQSVVDQRDDVKLIREQKHFPGQPSDGGYQALLMRD